MLEVKNISKNYEGSPLLKDISFTLGASETICLLGTSGSGKSTLLRVIAGLEPADSGLILFKGRDLKPVATHAREFGLVFQDYGLFPHLNVFDNVAFGLRMHRVSPSRINQIVGEWLSHVNLSGFENRKVTDLSGGEQQRVALVRALAPEPRLLMLDEPLGALDRTLKEDLLDLLRRILRVAGTPTIYVTHDQEEAFTIADRILLLHDGRIVRAGTPAEVWSDPGSAWVAKFLKTGNVVDGVAGSRHTVRTDFGIFDLQCGHDHRKGERVPILIRQTTRKDHGRGVVEIKLEVADVFFQRDQFQVRTEYGLTFHTRRRPETGQDLQVRILVECLA